MLFVSKGIPSYSSKFGWKYQLYIIRKKFDSFKQINIITLNTMNNNTFIELYFEIKTI